MSVPDLIGDVNLIGDCTFLNATLHYILTSAIPEPGNVTLDVFSLAGQHVDRLVKGYIEAGYHTVLWDGERLSAGMDICSVTSGTYSRPVKMLLIK